MRVIKAIIFDCFGVLTTETWHAFLNQLHDPSLVVAVQQVHKAYSAGLISKEENLSQIAEITGRQFLEPEDNPGAMVKNEQLLEFIKELKATYKIGLLSNIGNNWVREEFLSSDEQTLFDEMIFSFEVGMNKPDPRIYMLACERLRVGPHEAIMVDDQQQYIAAAKAEGMEGLVYNNFSQFKTELEPILSRQ